MRHIAIIPVLTAALALPATAQMIISGKVTSGSNSPVEGATVFINDLGLTNSTSVDGAYQLTVPASWTKGQTVNLRLRAIGFAPAQKVIELAPGKLTFDFVLSRDTAREVIDRMMTTTKNPRTTSGTAPARIPYGAASKAAVAQGGGGARGVAPAAVEIPVAADPFNRFLFQPELVMRYQDALALTEDQRAKLQTAMEDAQKRAVQVQWALALENEKLQKALDKPVVDEKETIGAMDRIVGVEREMKRAQLELLVKIKNTLTQDQQERLKKLRGYDN